MFKAVESDMKERKLEQIAFPGYTGKNWIDAKLDLMVRLKLYRFNTGKIETYQSSADGSAVIWRRPIIRSVPLIKKTLEPQQLQQCGNSISIGVWTHEMDRLTNVTKLDQSAQQASGDGIPDEVPLGRKRKRNRTKKKVAEGVANVEGQADGNGDTGADSSRTSIPKPMLKRAGHKRKRVPASQRKKKLSIYLGHRDPSSAGQSEQTIQPEPQQDLPNATESAENVYLANDGGNQTETPFNLEGLCE